MVDTIYPEKEVTIIESSDDKGSRRRCRAIRAVKDALFLLKLRRRNREKRVGSDSSMRRSFSFHFRKRRNETESRSELVKSASSASSPRTSVSSINHQNPKPQKQSRLKRLREEQGKRRGAVMIGSVLILMSLALTILWGKVWAIAFNAMWLACIPQKWGLRSSRGGVAASDGVEEPVNEQRRRVIMEGLLDRRHRHNQRSAAEIVVE